MNTQLTYMSTWTHTSHIHEHTTHIHEHTTHRHEHTQLTYMNTHTYAYTDSTHTHTSVLPVSSHCLWSQKCEEQGYCRKRRWGVYSTVEHSAVSWARNQTAKTKCLVGPSEPRGRNQPPHFTEEKATLRMMEAGSVSPCLFLLRATWL